MYVDVFYNLNKDKTLIIRNTKLKDYNEQIN